MYIILRKNKHKTCFLFFHGLKKSRIYWTLGFVHHASFFLALYIGGKFNWKPKNHHSSTLVALLRIFFSEKIKIENDDLTPNVKKYIF